MRISLWWIMALLILPTAGTLWFGFSNNAPLPFDNWWYDFVIAPLDTFWFSVAHTLHFVGSTKTMAVIGVVIFAFFIVMQRWREALAIAGTLLSVLVVTAIIKFLVDRPRPLDMLVEQSETSFPSGHSLGAAATMTIVVCIIVANNPTNTTAHLIAYSVGGVYVVTMLWSRTALHVHWFSDTVAAASLGVAIGLLFARLCLVVPNEEAVKNDFPPAPVA